jgi:predicted TIM-barrel fold metal-dependent hydrolase
MNVDHNLAALLFPTFSQVCGQTFHFSAPQDPDLALLCVRAYNDWMLDEWCGAAPGRFIGNMLVPLWDPAGAAREIERTAGLGARAVSFPGLPTEVGLPAVNDDQGYWDPLLAAAADTGLVVCTHLAMLPGLVGIRVLQAWLASSKFQQFPNLKLALSEGGIGWIPASIGALEWSALTMKRMSSQPETAGATGASRAEPNPHNWSTPGFISAQPMTEMLRAPLDVPFLEVFREHVYGCFIYDPLGIRTIDEIGRDNVMIETDFPHASGLWPNSYQVANEQMASFSPEDRYKVLQGNARRVFHFEPASPPAG